MTGFILNLKSLGVKLDKLANVRADEFYDEVMEFTRKSLNTAQGMTPTRDYSLIRKNQLKQYSDRVNCIPSSHRLIDPSLRIDPRTKKHWLYFSGKWWNASEWKLPANAFAAYGPLLAEHQRRITTTQATFIRERAQARFLYRKTWSETAESLGLQVSTSANVREAHTRHDPPKAPPRGYGDHQGGDKVFTVSIYNPLLKQPSRYKDFDGVEIMGRAIARHKGEYERSVRARIRQLATA